MGCRLLTNKHTHTHTRAQTDRQTNWTINITSFDFVGGGNKIEKHSLLKNFTYIQN